MKAKFLSLLIIMLLRASFNPQAKAQDPDKYQPILFLIIDAEYEKALSKAEKFTNRDKTKRHPEPYFLLSMAYYEISKDESMKEDFPRAFREAIKYAYKGARYDKEDEYVGNYEDYLTELKVDLMRESRFFYDEGSWRKSVTNAKYVTRIDPEDLSALLLKGAAEMRSRNAYQAEKTFEEAVKLAETTTASSISSAQKPFLRFGIMEYAKIAKENGEREKAQPLIALGEETFEEDAEFQNFIASF